MGARHTLSSLNAASVASFVAALGGIYEHSPWAAEGAAAARPFNRVQDLIDALRATVDAATEPTRLALLRAHPELAGKAAQAGELTAASRREQRGAGLTALDAQTLAEVQRLNKAYRDRFGFPFIVAVRAHTQSEILSQWRARLNNDVKAERVAALAQVHEIARHRLLDLVDA